MTTMHKIGFQILNRVAPNMASKKIYDVMSNPRTRKIRTLEERVLDSAHSTTFDFDGFQIAQYSWGNYNTDVAFLVHGWEGHAGNFGALISILVESGYKVVAMDAPAHGRSSSGRTNMSQFKQLVSKMMKDLRPKVVVSHSFGSVTTIMALSQNENIPVDKWIAVTTPHDYKHFLGQVQEKIGATDQTMSKVIEKVESDFASKVDQMNMDYFNDKIQHVNDILIVHSKNDRILPIESARLTANALTQSRLLELENYGHNSILWSDELKEILRNELTEESLSAA